MNKIVSISILINMDLSCLQKKRKILYRLSKSLGISVVSTQKCDKRCEDFQGRSFTVLLKDHKMELNISSKFWDNYIIRIKNIWHKNIRSDEFCNSRWIIQEKFAKKCFLHTTPVSVWCTRHNRVYYCSFPFCIPRTNAHKCVGHTYLNKHYSQFTLKKQSILYFLPYIWCKTW